MRYASYIGRAGESLFGALSSDGTHLSDLSAPNVGSLREAIAAWGMHGLAARAAAVAHETPLTGVRLLPPIPQPGKIICVGVNYRSHGEEAGRDLPKKPSLFIRFPDSMVGHLEPVLIPTVSNQLDWEAELAVVIGSPARAVSPGSAGAVIAGYSCFAENSVRDYQKHAAQVTAGKNFHKSGAWGPWLVSADEVADLKEVEVIGRLNDEEVQRDRVSSLIFSVEEIISYISEFTPLAPGDVIATGTPAGVGALRNPPRFMQPGDCFEVEISSIGVLTNSVHRETPQNKLGIGAKV